MYEDSDAVAAEENRDTGYLDVSADTSAPVEAEDPLIGGNAAMFEASPQAMMINPYGE